jgi:ectoine hydroxylase-related dioxygenase (phytanoyl-CoA dioxygenase family)
MQIDMSFYKKNGYLLLRNFFPPDTITVILQEAKTIFLKQFYQKGYIQSVVLSEINEEQFNECLYRLFKEDIECLSNCGKQAQHLISLHTLSLQPAVIELLKAVGITRPVISTRPVMFFNHPRLAQQKVFYKVDAHQDWRSMQGSLNSVVIWLPLVDINKDLGALEIIPGSHLSGLLTDHIESGFGMVKLTEEEEQQQLHSVEVEVGDILLFSSFLIHQSGENITNKPRWSCHFRYNDLDEKTFIQRKYAHPYVYKPAEELITPGFPSPEDMQNIFS